jgi:hypothetical protein
VDAPAKPAGLSRTTNPTDRQETVRGDHQRVPRVIPVYAHRCLPAGLAEHPVLSIYQTDVITYGNDLLDWPNREFGRGTPAASAVRPSVAFWRDLL